MVKITTHAARELRAIQTANARDETHVLRIESEAEGFSLWLGPEQEGDTVVGSEETILLRATPELTRYLRKTCVIIDCMEYEEGLRLIVYPEGEPPPQFLKAKKERRQAKKRTERAGPASQASKGRSGARKETGPPGPPTARPSGARKRSGPRSSGA